VRTSGACACVEYEFQCDGGGGQSPRALGERVLSGGVSKKNSKIVGVRRLKRPKKPDGI